MTLADFKETMTYPSWQRALREAQAVKHAEKAAEEAKIKQEKVVAFNRLFQKLGIETQATDTVHLIGDFRFEIERITFSKYGTIDYTLTIDQWHHFYGSANENNEEYWADKRAELADLLDRVTQEKQEKQKRLEAVPQSAHVVRAIDFLASVVHRATVQPYEALSIADQYILAAANLVQVDHTWDHDDEDDED